MSRVISVFEQRTDVNSKETQHHSIDQRVTKILAVIYPIPVDIKNRLHFSDEQNNGHRTVQLKNRTESKRAYNVNLWMEI